MDPSRVSRILKDWAAVTSEARRPAMAPRPARRSGLSSGLLAGTAVVAVALLVAVVWLGRPGPTGVVGTSPSALPSPSSTPIATASPSPTATSSPSPTPTPAPTQVAVTPPPPTASPAPTVGPCRPASLAARITLPWEGAAGHRIANVELTNAGTEPCTIPAVARPQLVDGSGSILIDGAKPPASERITIGPGAVLKTLVQDGNYCGPKPVAPVTVAFVFDGGSRVVATPVKPSDATVPPCLATPGSAGDIEMQPWSP
jgi:hypothetical protein